MAAGRSSELGTELDYQYLIYSLHDNILSNNTVFILATYGIAVVKTS